MNIPRGLLSFGLILIALASDAHPLDRWHPRNPTPTSMGLNGIAYGSGKFVAVGEFGTVVTSSNGSDWEVQTSLSSWHLNGIVYGNNQFIAVGEGGTIFSSTNGITWVNASPPTTNSFTCVGYGNPTNSPSGLFVAISTSDSVYPTVFSSQDGMTWQSKGPHVSLAGSSFSGIAFGNGRFVASRTTGVSGIFSGNGTDWYEARQVTGSVGYGNGQFVVALLFLFQNGAPSSVISKTSFDGYNWPNWGWGGSGYRPSGISFGGGQFVAVGGPGLTGVSQDGTNWSVNVLDTDASLRSVAFNGEIFVAVGSAGVIFSSTDGISWIQRSAGPSRTLVSVASAGDKCVATGWSGNIAWSSNGVNWIAAPPPTTNDLRAAFYSRDQYVFAGNRGTIVTGTDLTSLTIRNSGTERLLNAISCDQTTFVVVGSTGTVVTSENTVDWNVRDSGVTNSLNGIAHGNGVFAAVGHAGTIITSQDGQKWDQRQSGANGLFLDIAFGNGVFVAVLDRSDSAVFISSDGIDWAPVSHTPPGLKGIAFGNAIFVYPINTTGAAKFNVSVDGRSWEQRTVSQNYPIIRDLAFHDGAFFSVSDFGRIWQSDPVFRVVFDGSTSIGAIEGASSGQFRVQSSSELGLSDSWIDLTNLTSFPYIFADPGANSHPSRFYRARLVE